jgi:hypothetical protein
MAVLEFFIQSGAIPVVGEGIRSTPAQSGEEQQKTKATVCDTLYVKSAVRLFAYSA